MDDLKQVAIYRIVYSIVNFAGSTVLIRNAQMVKMRNLQFKSKSYYLIQKKNRRFVFTLKLFHSFFISLNTSQQYWVAQWLNHSPFARRERSRFSVKGSPSPSFTWKVSQGGSGNMGPQKLVYITLVQERIFRSLLRCPIVRGH